jgi:hypothetical protein
MTQLIVISIAQHPPVDKRSGLMSFKTSEGRRNLCVFFWTNKPHGNTKIPHFVRNDTRMRAAFGMRLGVAYNYNCHAKCVTYKL